MIWFPLSRNLRPCCSKGFSVPCRNFKCASDVCGHTLLTWVLHLNANKLWSFISFLCHTNKCTCTCTCTDTVKYTRSHTFRLALMTEQLNIYFWVLGRVGWASALCWKHMCCVGVTGGSCAQAQSCNVFPHLKFHESGGWHTQKNPPPWDAVTIRRFVMDKLICTQSLHGS